MSNKVENLKCYKEIGIMGDGSCPELTTHSHCKNCPTYFAIARKFFNRPTPEGFIKDWSESISGKKEQRVGETISMLIFSIGPEWFALKTLYLREIIEREVIHSVPFRTNKTFLGLVNVDGELMLCISLGNLVGLDEAKMPTKEEINEAGNMKMLIISHKDDSYVIPSGDIKGIYKIEISKLKNVPVTIAKSSSTLTKMVISMDGLQIGIIEGDKMFENIKRSLIF